MKLSKAEIRTEVEKPWWPGVEYWILVRMRTMYIQVAAPAKVSNSEWRKEGIPWEAGGANVQLQSFRAQVKQRVFLPGAMTQHGIRARATWCRTLCGRGQDGLMWVLRSGQHEEGVLLHSSPMKRIRALIMKRCPQEIEREQQWWEIIYILRGFVSSSQHPDSNEHTCHPDLGF